MFKHKDATKHGIDIAKGRVDTLDKQVLQYALNHKGRKLAVDLGSGESRLSAMLLLLGWEVWLYDIKDLSEYCATLENFDSAGEKIHIRKVDLNELQSTDLPNDVSLVVSQRTLHHLPYTSAINLLQNVYNKMTPDAKLFVSVSGVDSKLAEGYDCANSPISERFCKVGGEGQTTYSITDKVCLYAKEDARELVEGVGLNIESMDESDFGNIRIIANK